MRILLVSAYELGHQPVHVASPAAGLLEAGHDVRAVDVAVDEWKVSVTDWADAIAFSVPMHTAMRLAVGLARGVRQRHPLLPICFYGLYAAVSRDSTVGTVADVVLAGEYEPALLAWATAATDSTTAAASPIQLGRTSFSVPAREVLPPLDRYARLVVGDESWLAGAVEATHGCSHRCRHCPLPVIYDGQLRRVGADVVLADVDQLVAAGAGHVTFADPDFLNAPSHSLRVVRAVHVRHPELTFDCTTKVEHILAHAELWPELAAAGCRFVVSAFESVDDDVLGRLDKGHVAADASAAVTLLRRHGVEIRPSWLPFTPWATPASVSGLLDFVVAHDLVDNVDPVQYSIRLLVPEGSLMLELADMRAAVRGYNAQRLSWEWEAFDRAADQLQREIAALVERRAGEPAKAVFPEVRALVSAATGEPAVPVELVSRGPAAARPRLSEPWFCCSEPTSAQQIVAGLS